jgi:allantoin racemase
MVAKKKLLVVIPINTDAYNEQARDYIAPVVAPDFTFDVANIEGGFPAIQSRYSLQRNAQFVTQLVVERGPSYDGVFVSDFDGAGVDACRECLTIPVVDGFGPQASIALNLAQTFSIITLSDTLIGLGMEHPRAMGISQNLVSIRAMDLKVSELWSDPQAVQDRAFDAAKRAVDHDGAQALLLGCTAMMGLAEPLAERLAAAGLAVPVIDPNRASVTYLQMLVRCGLSQSPRCYPTPPELSQEPATAAHLEKSGQIKAVALRHVLGGESTAVRATVAARVVATHAVPLAEPGRG